MRVDFYVYFQSEGINGIKLMIFHLDDIIINTFKTLQSILYVNKSPWQNVILILFQESPSGQVPSWINYTFSISIVITLKG